MKIKNKKFVKRWVEYYKINFDYHMPYRFLIDGNFLKICVDKKFPLIKKLESYFKGICWIYATSCVIKELESIGEGVFDTLLEAKKIKYDCGHIHGVGV